MNDTTIQVRDGDGVHRLTLLAEGSARPVLTDAAGALFMPWEVELVRWPPEAEEALRRGGYFPGRPVTMDLWCNCAD